jgi:uncharacterized membrane protein
MCKEYKLSIYSVITGILITLITGTIPNFFLIGVKYWGYFLPWLRLVYSGSLEVSWIYFFVDAVIWSVFVYLTILSVVEEEAKKRPARKRRR